KRRRRRLTTATDDNQGETKETTTVSYDQPSSLISRFQTVSFCCML
ncbi:unnamed protein product, partial [Linum tenue]